MKKILLSVLAIIAFVLIMGMILPSQWKVERSILIKASPSAIYPLVADLKTGWAKWSSFDDEDPGITYQYSGPQSGAGATRSWVSKKMGDGFQKIVEGTPSSGILYELEMTQNHFKMEGRIAFSPEGDSTRVTWTDSGDVGANPIYRYLGILMNKMMGPTFEKSLSKLKQQVEARGH